MYEKSIKKCIFTTEIFKTNTKIQGDKYENRYSISGR
jgi:hypothetical protein